MSYEILYTSHFKKELKALNKKHRSVKTDLKELIASLRENPEMGISIGMDCFKIRMAIASKGKGKSGGARIITHLYVEEETVYLLSIFDKSKQDTISEKKIKALLKGIH